MLLKIEVSVGVRLRLRVRPKSDVPTMKNRRKVVGERKIDFDILLGKEETYFADTRIETICYACQKYSASDTQT